MDDEAAQGTNVRAIPRREGQPVRRAMPTEETVMEPLSISQLVVNAFTWLVASVLVLAEGILGLRLAFKLLSAENTNWVVKFFYHISGGLIRPFNDVIPVHTIVGGGIFEPAVVIAMVLFAIGAVLAIWVVRSLATLGSWGSGRLWR